MSTRLTRTSTFDLTAFDPDLGYELALGGLDNFLTQQGVPAIGVSEARIATITGGADLPLGFTVTLSHSLTPDDTAPAGERGVPPDGDDPTGMAGRKRAVDPLFSRR